MGLDVSHRHPAGIQRDDHVVEPAETANALGDQAGLEGPGPVPGRGQGHVADLGPHRLWGGPVSGVRRAPPGRVALLIAEMASQLGLQTPLEDRLDQARQKPALAGQLQLAGIDSRHQLIEQPGLHQLLHRSHLSRTLYLVIGHGHGHLPH